MKWLRVREMGICMAIASAMSTTPVLAQLVLEIESEPPEAGIVGSYPNLSTFVEGEFVTVTATAAEGFEFAGWEGDIAASESSMTFEMIADTYLTAVFIEAVGEYALTAYVDPSGAGTIIREPAEFTYAEGAEVTVTAYAGEGFVFTGWTGDVPEGADADSPALTLTMDADVDVRATFAAGLALDDENDAAGGPCGCVGVVGWGLLVSMMLMMKFARAVR